MPCEKFETDDGVTMIVCGRGGRRHRCSVDGCTAAAEKQCDGRKPKRRSKTCDRYLCEAHAHTVGSLIDQDIRLLGADTLDLCPDCRRALDEPCQLSLL